MKKTVMISAALLAASSFAKPKPNVVVILADDISAREFPMYGSSVWTDVNRQTTSDPVFRAKTPVLDRLAQKGVFIKIAWGATVCSPSRAMLMTGRYASIHKWWNNGDLGRMVRNGKRTNDVIPLYSTSPMLIGHMAQQAGYATQWTGKTQMKKCDYQLFGFEEGCFTPGSHLFPDNTMTDFRLVDIKGAKPLMQMNMDTGKPVKYYAQDSWYWQPCVALMNHPGTPPATKENPVTYWPISAEDKASYGINTYGPDVELNFIFEFMNRKHAEGKPFFVYHAMHLGHDGFDWFDPDKNTCWPSTPIVEWDGQSYRRIEPHVTGDRGVYAMNNSVTEPGIHSHVEYIDYQIWQYINHFKQLGIDENTVLIFCADNGTSKYGKGSADRQKGTHVPFVVYAPGAHFTKHGEQDILVNLADILPTVADAMGFKIPVDYTIHGKSLWPYLTTDATTHRDWIYAYKRDQQLIRGKKVMRDGYEKWWDVEKTPDDLISFHEIKDWERVSPAHRKERDRLQALLPQFDLHETEHDFQMD